MQLAGPKDGDLPYTQWDLEVQNGNSGSCVERLTLSSVKRWRSNPLPVVAPVVLCAMAAHFLAGASQAAPFQSITLGILSPGYLPTGLEGVAYDPITYTAEYGAGGYT